ncbi:hypothetical protein PINS_up006116 [Pythium insidiosum]|nr:hypothetical protein PINS_up006116 [Pythium insidiosum]
MLMTQKPEALPDQSLWAMSTPNVLNGARSHQDASSVLSTATIKPEATAQIFHVTSPTEATPRNLISTDADQLPGTTKRRPKAKAERSEAELQYKRKRHADAERERIHRKRAEILRMRVLVDQLELQLRTLHDSVKTESNQPHLDVHPWLESALADGSEIDEDVRQLYIRALAQSGWLRRERAMLQARLDEYGLVEATVESLLQDLVDATLEPPEPPRDPRTSEPASTISYEDLLSDECFTMMRDLMHESKIFNVHCDDDQGHARTTLDWAARCHQDEKDVRFSLSKSFADADLNPLMTSVWRAFHDPTYSRTIFSPSLRLEVLQRLNEDALIVRWQFDCQSILPYRHSCRNLVFRWKTEDGGQFVGCRTIDEPLLDADNNPADHAFDQFYWARFHEESHEDGRSTCHATFAGRIGIGNGTKTFARFLITEIPIAIMRWESAIFGPPFTLSQ